MMETTTDQHFINLTLSGDTHAFSHLVEKYQVMVYNMALKMLKVKEEAEEVAQDSFIKAYESLSTFRGESKFSSWLYSIVYRKSLDRIRKNNRSRTVDLVEETTSIPLETLDNALHQLEIKERNTIIKKGIDTLPESDAAIVIFFYFEELSIKEIAEITQLSEDNIKVKLHRSRKKLFTLLQDYVFPKYNETHGRAL